MKLYSLKEAVAIYTAFLNNVRINKSKATVFLRRTPEGLELVGEADKGTSRHDFGFDRVFITEETGDDIRRTYFVELQE